MENARTPLQPDTSSFAARRAVDVWAQTPTSEFMAQPWMETLLRWIKRPDDRDETTVAATLAAMDAAGVETTLLSAWSMPSGPLLSNAFVAERIAEAPARLRGLMTVDLRDPMGAVREIRSLAGRDGFVGVRLVPWLWNLPPNDRLYYPVYAACVDAGVPFCTQIGHTGPLLRSETGRPIPYLEDVLLDFPELTVVGGHVGFPWIDEVLSLAHKFPNFHIDTSAYAVHRLPPALVAFMKGEGRSRVLFGTNWPMLSPERCLERLADLGLSAETEALFLGGNARRVFGLDADKAVANAGSTERSVPTQPRGGR